MIGAPILPPWPMSTQYPSSLQKSLAYFMSMGCAYKFFGFSISKNKLSEQPEQKQNHRYGDHLEGCLLYTSDAADERK